MKEPRLNQWIERLLARDPPRSKSLMVTVLGDSLAPHGGAAWLGSLIAFLAPFDINERLVRTTVQRLTREGWLEAARAGRRSRYMVTASGLRRLERAYRRIYSPPSASWDGRWTVVMVPPDSIGPTRRPELRQRLAWEGFSMVAPGLFAHPAAEADTLRDMLRELGVERQVFVFSACDLERPLARPLRDGVNEFWDLTRVTEGYRGFIAGFSPLADLLPPETSTDPEQAFVLRTLLIHSFRRALLDDPLLPRALLPADWPGTAARDLCRDLYHRLWEPADRYVVATLGAEDDSVPTPEAAYFARFGGRSAPAP